MPNWCYNSLEVKGKPKDLEEFKVKYKGEADDKWIDLDKVISKDELIAEQKLEWDKLSTEEKKERWMDDFETFWFNNGGYEWNIQNWGTKWNPIISEPTLANDVLGYGFSTAWSPMDKAFIELVKQNPKLEFKMYFEEMGECFAGNMYGKNGELLVDETYTIETAECPECECTAIKKENTEQFVCEDCGHKFDEVQE